MFHHEDIVVQPIIELIHLLPDLPHVRVDLLKDLAGGEKLLP